MTLREGTFRAPDSRTLTTTINSGSAAVGGLIRNRVVLHVAQMYIHGISGMVSDCCVLRASAVSCTHVTPNSRTFKDPWIFSHKLSSDTWLCP